MMAIHLYGRVTGKWDTSVGKISVSQDTNAPLSNPRHALKEIIAVMMYVTLAMNVLMMSHARKSQ